MTIIYAIGGVLIVLWTIRLLASFGKINVSMGTLALMLERTYLDDASGRTRAFLQISFRGCMRLPERTTRATSRIRIMDISDPDTPLPVHSLIPELMDEDGNFFFEITNTIPSGSYQFGTTALVHFELNGLHAPFQGGRVLDVHVQFISDVDGSVHSEEHQILHLLEERTGYVETMMLIGLAEEKQQRLIDLLGIGDSTTMVDEINECIDELLSYPLGGLGESTYQLCLIAANKFASITAAHRALLAHIAQRLALPDGLIAELNDQHLRITAMVEATDSAALGVPQGISEQDQLAFLAAEYRKWRARATSVDPAIAAEATARMEAIARARAALTQGGSAPS